MRTLVPLSEGVPWSITSASSTNDGPIDDLTIAIDRGPRESRCSIRTIRRTGTRIGPRSSVHGQMTDAVSTAALAIGSLLLEVISAGLEAHEAHAAMEEVDARSTTLARDGDGWGVRALTLDGADYALFTRVIPEGTVAHADLGWATIAMWSTGPLHRGPFVLAEVSNSS